MFSTVVAVCCLLILSCCISRLVVFSVLKTKVTTIDSVWIPCLYFSAESNNIFLQCCSPAMLFFSLSHTNGEHSYPKKQGICCMNPSLLCTVRSHIPSGKYSLSSCKTWPLCYERPKVLLISIPNLCILSFYPYVPMSLALIILLSYVCIYRLIYVCWGTIVPLSPSEFKAMLHTINIF